MNAREVVEACARAGAYERARWVIAASLSPSTNGLCVYQPPDGPVKCSGDRAQCVAWINQQMALAVIRALAEAGCTEEMERAAFNAIATRQTVLGAMLTALADAAEREGGE